MKFSVFPKKKISLEISCVGKKKKKEKIVCCYCQLTWTGSAGGKLLWSLNVHCVLSGTWCQQYALKDYSSYTWGSLSGIWPKSIETYILTIKLSISDKKCAQVLINRLDNEACPGKVCLGKLTGSTAPKSLYNTIAGLQVETMLAKQLCCIQTKISWLYRKKKWPFYYRDQTWLFMH